MHARIATYRLTDSQAPEVVDVARQGMLPIFQEIPGFVRYAIVDPGDGTIVSVSLWETAVAADEAVRTAAGFVADKLASQLALQSNAVGNVALFEGTRSSL
jgi:heme-degrading monooxygenase HmoA